MATRPVIQLGDLAAESEYLVSQQSTSGHLLIHTRLTESCLKAIDYLAAKPGTRGHQFKVLFTEDGGYIALPDDKGERKFRFNVQQGPSSGNLEILHQWRQGSVEQKLENLGSIRHRVIVQATDDVYEVTKERAKQVEKERKEGSKAQEIELTSNSSRGKLKIIQSKKNHPPKPRPALPPKKVPARVPKGTSIKDYLIHVLALKSLKLEDILQKLKSVGLTVQSQDELTTILQEVSDLNGSSNMYVLKRSILLNLEVDGCPYLSSMEKNHIKKNINFAKKNSPEPNPRKRLPSSDDKPPAKQSYKLPHNSVQIPKKLRPVSPMERQLNNTDSSPGNAKYVTPRIGIKGSDSRTLKPKEEGNKPSETVENSLKKHSAFLPTIGNGTLPNSPLVTSTTKEKKKKKKQKKVKPEVESTTNQHNAESHTEKQMDTAMSREGKKTEDTVEEAALNRINTEDLKPIENQEQRINYKAMFNAVHPIYMKLCQKITNVSETFSRLQKEIEQHEKGSPQYEAVHKQIKDIYGDTENDFDRDKNLFDKLHYRLGLIKKYISEYDRLHNEL